MNTTAKPKQTTAHHEEETNTGLLLLNVGSTEAPTTKAVKKYLKAFLNDPYVMDMPAFWRKLLVHGIIVPFRAKKSAQRYAQLWTKEGSPLTHHLNVLSKKLSHKLQGKIKIYSAVSYGQPSLDRTIKKIKDEGITTLKVLPLYPHYAQATTEGSIAQVQERMQDSSQIKCSFITQFYSHKSFIDAVAKQASNYTLSDYDHILFSYHSLPLKQIEKVKKKHSDLTYDYKASCEKTSELLAQQLQLENSAYSTAYQSRFSKRWQGPYTNEVLEELLQNNKKKVLVFTPSFVADCLETTVEIGIEYKNDFLQKGGEQLDLVPCPNADDNWVDGIIDLTH